MPYGVITIIMPPGAPPQLEVAAEPCAGADAAAAGAGGGGTGPMVGWSNMHVAEKRQLGHDLHRDFDLTEGADPPPLERGGTDADIAGEQVNDVEDVDGEVANSRRVD